MNERGSFTVRLATLCMLFGARVCMGCTGEVALGESVGSRDLNTIDSPSYEQELAAGTVMLLSLDGHSIKGLAVDEQFLYLQAFYANSETAKLQRCSKYDCAATMVDLIETPLVRTGLQLVGKQLTWRGLYGLEYCEVPYCRKLQMIAQGAVLEPYSAGAVYFDDAHVYFNVNSDRTIYRSEFPDSTSETIPFLTQVASRYGSDFFGVSNGSFYWLDSAVNGLMRVAVDGKSTPEQVDFARSAAYTARKQELDERNPMSSLIVSGHQVYLLMSNKILSATGPEAAPVAQHSLARFHASDPVRTFEWILTGDASLNSVETLQVFGNDLVWSKGGNELFSCAAEACTSTKRVLGTLADLHGEWNELLAADDRYVYWTSAKRDNMGNQSALQIKRSPRIRR